MQQSDIIRENQVLHSIYGLAEHDQDLLWQHTGRHSATDPEIKQGARLQDTCSTQVGSCWLQSAQPLILLHSITIQVYTCGLNYKHVMIVNDDSSAVNKRRLSLTDDTRVIIYDRNMFIIQVQYCKTVQNRNLLMFAISQSVCSWQAFLAQSNVCE